MKLSRYNLLTVFFIVLRCQHRNNSPSSVETEGLITPRFPDWVTDSIQSPGRGRNRGNAMLKASAFYGVEMKICTVGHKLGFDSRSVKRGSKFLLSDRRLRAKNAGAQKFFYFVERVRQFSAIIYR
jgi:hypothetical protein